MKTTDITPKLRDALLLALRAPERTLTRCAAGFHSPSDRHAGAVTRRTANTLHNAMLGEFNAADIPSAITLTPRGVDLAQQIEAAELAKARAA